MKKKNLGPCVLLKRKKESEKGMAVNKVNKVDLEVELAAAEADGSCTLESPEFWGLTALRQL